MTKFGAVDAIEFTDCTEGSLEAGLIQTVDYDCCVYEFGLFVQGGVLAWRWKRLSGDCVSHV